MDLDINQLYIIGDVLIATLLSGIIGFEREKLNKPAGLRTNMIVGGATCLIVLLATPLIKHVGASEENSIMADPIRLLEALVVGISFIGAGTIVKQKGSHIEGLTTAATLLYSLCIGVAVALNYLIVAIGVTIIVILVNFLLRQLELISSKKKKDVDKD